MSILKVYVVRQESKETAAIFFYLTFTHKSTLSPLKYFPWEATQRRNVAPTPGSSAGSLHVEMPSAGLSRHFGCCPQFQNDEL